MADHHKRGGQNIAKEKRSFSKDRNLAREAGRKGGVASGRTRRERAEFSKRVDLALSKGES